MNNQEALVKLQSIELEILDVIADFCSENSITWWLDGGTCLGSMRHNGFIPWDDDVDIAMLREDYDRFCDLAAHGLPDGYSLHTSDNTEGFAALFAKVYKDGTRFENQEGRDAESSTGIFVDVFPYDRLYVDPKLRRAQIFRASLAQKRSYLYFSKTIQVPHKGLLGGVEKLACILLHSFERILSNGPKTYQRLFDSCVPSPDRGDVSDECLTLAWPNMSPIPVHEIKPLGDALFEGHNFPVPRLTDRYLTVMYGDWRQIPAPEDRHTHLPLLLDFGDGDVWEAGE